MMSVGFSAARVVAGSCTVFAGMLRLHSLLASTRSASGIFREPLAVSGKYLVEYFSR